MTLEEVQIQVYITQLEKMGEISSDCKMCVEIFYPQLLSSKKLYEIFAPGHIASSRCKSGKHPHCTCDVCF
jgi:hypothetical protein